jgi:hypothetical protein
VTDCAPTSAGFAGKADPVFRLFDCVARGQTVRGIIPRCSCDLAASALARAEQGAFALCYDQAGIDPAPAPVFRSCWGLFDHQNTWDYLHPTSGGGKVAHGCGWIDGTPIAPHGWICSGSFGHTWEADHGAMRNNGGQITDSMFDQLPDTISFDQIGSVAVHRSACLATAFDGSDTITVSSLTITKAKRFEGDKAWRMEIAGTFAGYVSDAYYCPYYWCFPGAMYPTLHSILRPRPVGAAFSVGGQLPWIMAASVAVGMAGDWDVYTYQPDGYPVPINTASNHIAGDAWKPDWIWKLPDGSVRTQRIYPRIQVQIGIQCGGV